MAENTVTSRVHGYSLGSPHKPELVDTYKYHMIICGQDDAFKLSKVLCLKDEPTFITTTNRPNMFLVYNPWVAQSRFWKQMEYYEYVKILFGPYGTDYYIFGSGKVFTELPEMVD